MDKLRSGECDMGNLDFGLREIFNPSFSTFAHGSRIEVAEDTLEHGLRAMAPDLLSTTRPLFDYSKSLDEQAAQVAENILHWPHMNAPAVVVVMIPNPEDGELGGQQYFNSVFQELPEPDTGYNARYLIPPHYIKGYFDAEKRKFVINPRFQPEKPTVIKKTSARISSKVNQPQTSTNISDNSASENGEDSEIW